MEELVRKKEALEQESIRMGNRQAQSDLWMRVFRGGAVLSCALVIYGAIFALLAEGSIPVLIVGVLLLVLFLAISRVCKQRARGFQKKKEAIRQEYAEVCDTLDRKHSEVTGH